MSQVERLRLQMRAKQIQFLFLFQHIKIVFIVFARYIVNNNLNVSNRNMIRSDELESIMQILP